MTRNDTDNSGKGNRQMGGSGTEQNRKTGARGRKDREKYRADKQEVAVRTDRRGNRTKGREGTERKERMERNKQKRETTNRRKGADIMQ